MQTYRRERVARKEAAMREVKKKKEKEERYCRTSLRR